MTNRRKQVLDKEQIITAHFVVSLQNSNILSKKKKKKTILHLSEINRSAQIREVSPTCVSTSFALLAGYTQVACEENTFVPGILQD